MGSETMLRPITDARIEVIPRHRRQAALAAMARAAGRPTLRQVTDRSGLLTGDPDNDDIVIGMYARIGCAESHELAGIVRLRERYAPRIAVPGTPAPCERAFLIDALTIADSMLDWHPPVRTLLAATAATVVATISHDPSYKTFVAYRISEGDAERKAIPNIGGRPLEMPPGVDAARLSFVDVPSTELHFLDAAAADSAATIVRDHMTGGTMPSYEYDLPGRAGACQAILSVAFPRAFHHLKAEIDLIAASAVDVGWRSPTVVGNDATFPLRIAHA